MNQKTAIIVPARLNSQRFPQKLLVEIQGKPLIRWTAERIQQIVPEIDLYFAVGEQRLAEELEVLNLKAILTDPELPSGTDRIAVANEQVGADFVINVQADEPLVYRSHILALKAALEAGADLATLATPFESDKDFQDPNKVKVVCRQNGEALYFSRSPIPYSRDQKGAFVAGSAFWHLGLYAYTRDFLKNFRKWSPTPLEQLEKLEQLRALENGASISVAITQQRTVGIDTPEDLPEFEKRLDRD